MNIEVADPSMFQLYQFMFYCGQNTIKMIFFWPKLYADS